MLYRVNIFIIINICAHLLFFLLLELYHSLDLETMYDSNVINNPLAKHRAIRAYWDSTSETPLILSLMDGSDQLQIPVA